MSTAELNPRAVRVSPLIRVSRWTLLTFGILYGVYHHNRFSKIETKLREEEAKMKPIRDAKIAEAKRIASEAEMKELEKYFV